MARENSPKADLLQPSDFMAIFEKAPGLCLVMDASFVILAQNDAHASATMTKRSETVGRLLFEVFPDNPNDSGADGISLLRASLLNVLQTRRPDTIPELKFDIERPQGGFEVRYWSVTNTPVLGEDGFVRWIINSVADITELTLLRETHSAATGEVSVAHRM
jgi:PAS domain-containing protein